MGLAKRGTTKRGTGRTARGRRQSARRGVLSGRRSETGSKPAARPELPIVLYRVCKPGWAVVTEQVPSAPHTRFVCPFCPLSHRVPGPVRGFRRVRQPQWLKLRRVFE